MISDDRAFALLKRRIFLDRGLDCEQYKENYLKRRVAVRLRATGARDFVEYLQVLRRDPDEYTALLNEITVNVTEFFRDSDVYEKLQETIIPTIIKSKEAGGNKSLRIWSAGCASGEEPYSLAILLHKVMGGAADKWNLRVVGSDYDDKSLKIARAGVYRDLELPEEIEPERYFVVTAKGSRHEYKVREKIRAVVRFEKINLLEHEGRRQFDMVVCRNVLIYFGREMQVKLIEALAESILGEGYLVLGKSETIGPEASKFLKPIFSAERIYRVMSATKRLS